ncbi:MAG TPA: metallophosphoesterase [Myxococcota bacterium]|nr:metallophosphoesterase [Myxococcota bacterium]
MFGTVLTVAYTALLAYVLWRATSAPPFSRRFSRKWFLVLGAGLWMTFVFGRFIGHDGTGPLAATLEFVGMTLLGTVFLTSVVLFVVDLGTAFGRVCSRWAPTLRGWAIVAGGCLSLFALVQGLRAPAVSSYDVTLSGLPAALDGRVLVALSDAHIGSQLGEQWFAERLTEVQALRPDLVVFLGDMFEGHGKSPQDIPALRRLTAPLGKWYVDGNHESHGHGENGNPDGSPLERGGFRRLANGWVEPVPGLVLAGVDDLTNHKRRNLNGDPLAIALSKRPPGATILLSHTPWQAERAARAGVGLMLSGHTHSGQIWPVGYLVKAVYPLLAGRYEIEGMPVIVSRGTGTWGPRMRLWHRGEIVKVTLRSR